MTSTKIKEAPQKETEATDQTVHLTEVQTKAKDAAVASLRSLVETETRLTDFYKDMAERVLDLRKTFKHNGKTDWLGRSRDYRVAIGMVYAEAGIPQGRESAIQSNLRYHVSSALDKRLTRKQKTEYGLVVESVKDRKTTARREAADRADTPQTLNDAIALVEDSNTHEVLPKEEVERLRSERQVSFVDPRFDLDETNVGPCLEAVAEALVKIEAAGFDLLEDVALATMQCARIQTSAERIMSALQARAASVSGTGQVIDVDSQVKEPAAA